VAQAEYIGAGRAPRLPVKAGLGAVTGLAALLAFVFALDHLLRPDTFPVRQVSFEGTFERVSQEALARGVADAVTGNFFLVDLEAVRRQAERVPWVHRAAVRRRWPDGVHIRFTEQVLAARWGDDAWVNVDGERVALGKAAGPEGLPRLAGPDGTHAQLLDHHRRLSALLAPAGLSVARLTLTARHTWVIGLDNGIALIVGREDPEPKVERFARLYPGTLAGVADKVKEVDLRYTNGFAVEWAHRTNAGSGPRGEG
jgi:cell division protein FtsQ